MAKLLSFWQILQSVMALLIANDCYHQEVPNSKCDYQHYYFSPQLFSQHY